VLYLRDDCLGTELACNDDGPIDETSSVTLTLAQDDAVVVVVDGAGLESGNYDVNVELDSCPDADIGSTVPQSLAGTTVGGIDQAVGSCGTNGGSPDVAYTFTAPVTGLYQLDTQGSDFDTRLYVYDGATCAGTELGCDDDDGPGTTSLLLLDLVEDQLVTIVLDAHNGQDGNYDLNIDLYDSCGDFIVDDDEVCDFTIGAIKCEDLGFGGGVVDCADDCSGTDTAECSNEVIAVCSQPGAVISEAVPTTLDTIAVPDMGTIADVDLFLDITHTYGADLDIVLEADDLGLSNNVVFDQCFGPNDVFAFFNDEGNGPAGVDCTEPFGIEGNLTPLTPLSVYDGAEVNGSWTVSITDDAGGDVGTLNEWCLYFTLEP
jgi:hypothetical protein